MKKSPIIGVSLDWENTGGYSNYVPWYALRTNYFDAIVKVGGIPIALPYSQHIDEYIAMIDGLIIPGGDYDIPPSLYSQEMSDKIRVVKDNRVFFESELIKKCLKSGKPILGICAGEQLLAVLSGGDLIRHIPDAIKNPLPHEQKLIDSKPTETIHYINVEPGSLLHKITKLNSFAVNSTHHQAVKSVGPEYQISAYAPDGVVEAIEHKNYKFCLGVEWHPEYLNTIADQRIFEALIDAARNN